MSIRRGLYRHYKGNIYEVIQIARHTETLDDCIVYRALYKCPEYGNNAYWVRPYKMFTSTVNISGKIKPRFEYIGTNVPHVT